MFISLDAARRLAGGFAPARAPAPVVAPSAPRGTSLIMPGYAAPSSPRPQQPGYAPYPTSSPPIVAPSPISGQMGRTPEYVQYDIRNPAFAQLLREAFDTSGGSGWALASEIVPVFVVNSEGAGAGGGALPWVWEGLVAAAAAGTYAMVKVSNAADSSRLVTIDRIRAVTGGGTWFGVLEPTIRFDAVNDIWTVQAVSTTDIRAGRVQLVLTKGRIDGDADRDAYVVTHSRYFTHVAAIVQERTPGVVIPPGYDFILMAGLKAGAESMVTLSLEGTEQPI